MLYPQKGFIANGSFLKTPIFPVVAAVVSEFIVAPKKTPCSQLLLWKTRGTVVDLLPPKRIALIGTPSGFFQSGSNVGI